LPAQRSAKGAERNFTPWGPMRVSAWGMGNGVLVLECVATGSRARARFAPRLLARTAGKRQKTGGAILTETSY